MVVQRRQLKVGCLAEREPSREWKCNSASASRDMFYVCLVCTTKRSINNLYNAQVICGVQLVCRTSLPKDIMALNTIINEQSCQFLYCP